MDRFFYDHSTIDRELRANIMLEEEQPEEGLREGDG